MVVRLVVSLRTEAPAKVHAYIIIGKHAFDPPLRLYRHTYCEPCKPNWNLVNIVNLIVLWLLFRFCYRGIVEPNFIFYCARCGICFFLD